MSIGRTDVIRESIQQSPVSNTEIHFDRLPATECLRSMELRFREAPVVLPLIEAHLVSSFLILVCFGSLYVAGWSQLPYVVEWLLMEARSVDGMTVVGGMLGFFVVLLGLFCFLLLATPLRVAICGLSFPPALGILMRPLRAEEISLIAFSIAIVMAVLWKRSVIDFHKSWLSADPRLTTNQATAWMKSQRSGWSTPTPAVACQVLWRYLSHAPSYPNAPGQWNAPSGRLLRVFIASLFAGCTFWLSSSWQSAVGLAPFGLLLAVATSFIFLACALAQIAGGCHWLREELERQCGGDTRTTFQQHSERLRHSEHEAKDPITGASIREAEHLFLGKEPWQRFPIFLHRLLLGEHVYIAGRTGSGKTSMALMPLLIQLIRGFRDVAGWSEPKPVVIIDLKGDEPVLFHTARLEAKARGQKFRFFTLEPGKASFYFNPFVCFKSQSVTTTQLVQMVLDALALFHGFEYGRGYFSQSSRFMLSEALRNPTGVNNFRDLHARLQTLASQRPQDFQDARELRSVVESLTHYEQLITTDADEAGDDTIRFDRLLEEREVLYFWLPTTKESITSAHIGRLILLCLRVAAHDRQVAGMPKREVALMIDEFQKLTSEHFEKVLQQARSSGIGAILANQSIADLKTVDRDLVQTVRTNTRVKMFFSVTEPDELEAFRELSGEELQTFGVGEVEEIRLRLSTKDLAALSDHPKRFLLQVTSGSGYTQFAGLPIPVETDWPISKEVSDERAAMPWPRSPQIRTPAPAPSVLSKPKVNAAAPTKTATLASPPSSGSPPGPLPQPAQPAPSAMPTVAPSPQPPPAGGAPMPASKKRKATNAKTTPQPASPAPPAAVKKAFAQKVQSLFDQ